MAEPAWEQYTSQQDANGMFLEWGAMQRTSHQDTQHSPERCTVRCKFFTKMAHALKTEAKNQAGKDFTKKDMVKAFMDATTRRRENPPQVKERQEGEACMASPAGGKL